MVRLFCFISLLLFCCCSEKADRSQPVAQQLSNRVESELPYKSTLRLVIAGRDSIRNVYKKAGSFHAWEIARYAEIYFTRLVVENIIPRWYGTPWDFNGITQQPRQGQIACGYFVTTVLRDAGFTINRIRMAQSPSEKIIRTITDSKTVYSFSNKPVEKVDSVIRKLGPGLYLAGLDYHVGFLYYDNATVYFIHSNYIGRQGVVKEPMLQSSAFNHSKYRVIGKISTSNVLTRNWLN